MKSTRILILFTLLTFIMLYPLSINLTSMVAEPADPLLNAWRMHWNAQAMLTGQIANIFNTNIFYPYPLTLVYSEHFIFLTAQALPFLFITDSHLFGLNLSIILTFILSGYSMYLLVMGWTRHRWAGVIAGLIFTFSPQRLGQLNHLELLITPWLPLALLTLHWTLTRPQWRYAFALAVLLNLQALSGFHYFFNLVIACLLLTISYALTRQILWRRALWLQAALIAASILTLNWPIWRMYLRFSDTMGAVRTPGEVRIYSAAMTDYITTLPHNWLYGWTFGHWQAADHQFQPLMPLGITGILLVLIALASGVQRFSFASGVQRAIARCTPENSNLLYLTQIVYLIILTLTALILSFGLNENALGTTFAPLLQYSPYSWLYDNVIIFQAIRVPARFSVLVVLGLSILAGYGVSQLATWLNMYRHVTLNGAKRSEESLQYQSKSNIIGTDNESSKLTSEGFFTSFRMTWPLILITLFIIIESWSAPLIGPTFPTGQAIPPIYHWLRANTPAESVIAELPHTAASDFAYEYYSTYHWRRLLNGGTGYTPPIYKELRQWLNAFPDPRSVDVLQQLGVNYVILHQTSYTPDDWQRLMSDLPRYLPAIKSIKSVGDDIILQLSPPTCQTTADSIRVTFEPNRNVDGLSNNIAVTYHNTGQAAFMANVLQPSQLHFTQYPAQNFTEPLITPAGESQTVIVPVTAPHDLTAAWLNTLQRTVPITPPTNSPAMPFPETLKPLGLQFADGPQLVSYNLQPAQPIACSQLYLAARWQAIQPNDKMLVQLLDPFGRLVAEQSQPFTKQTDTISNLPLLGSLPAGRYGLRVRVQTGDGQERWPITADGVKIPPDKVPPLPLTIQPMPVISQNKSPLAEFQLPDKSLIYLTYATLQQTQLTQGDWLRFTLTWQADQPITQNYTIFTQLLGPDGQVWGQHDNEPQGGWYSTSLWQPQQAIQDDYAFPLNANAPTGDYRLIVGLYDNQTQTRLTTTSGADFVEVGQIRQD